VILRFVWQLMARGARGGNWSLVFSHFVFVWFLKEISLQTRWYQYSNRGPSRRPTEFNALTPMP
jgi:hypothetical protein